VASEVALPTMISTSGIFSAGEKKCRPMKLAGRADALGQAGDRQGRGVGGEDGEGDDGHALVEVAHENAKTSYRYKCENG
jgi:hypothetical protein